MTLIFLGVAQVALPAALFARLAPPAVGWPVRLFAGALATGAVVLVAHGLRISQPIALVGVVALAAGAAVLAQRLSVPAVEAALLERRSMAALAVALSPPAASALLRVMNEPVLEGDALETWFAKARGVLAWDPLASLPSANYPELGSVLWMLPLRWVGAGFENLGRAFFPVAFFLWVAALPRASARPPGPVAVLAALVAGLIAYDGTAVTNGYQDALVLVTAGFAAVVLLRLLAQLERRGGDPAAPLGTFAAGPGGRGELALAGFLTGAASLVKVEGAVWSALLGGTFIVVVLWGTSLRGLRLTARTLAPFLVTWVGTTVVWPAIVVIGGLGLNVQGAFSASAVLHADLGRWPAIRPYFEGWLHARGAGALAAALVSVACALLVPRLRRGLAFAWIVFAAHLAFVLLVFVSTEADLAWHLATAFQRLAYQGAFLPAAAAAVAIPAVAEALLSALATGRSAPASAASRPHRGRPRRPASRPPS